jgi:dTDP-glucose 4,6-dehydratase
MQSKVSNKKNIVVTGGLGFIGSHFVDLLLQQNDIDKIIIIDNEKIGSNPDWFQNISSKKVIHFKEDINNITKSDLNGIDFLVNFAAETHVDRSIHSPRLFYETNTLGVLNLCEKVVDSSIRFLQVSTDEVYGQTTNKNNKFTEKSLICPSSPYSASKAGGDLCLSSFVTTYKLDGLITRCTNNFGIRQNTEKLIPKLIESFIKEIPFPLYNQGKNFRDWIAVEDHCDAILKALFFGKTGTTYNIGSDCVLTNLEIIKIVEYSLQEYFKISREINIKHVDDRLGHDFGYSIDNRFTKKELNWKPCFNLLEKLPSMIFYYQEKLKSFQ